MLVQLWFTARSQSGRGTEEPQPGRIKTRPAAQPALSVPAGQQATSSA